MNPSTGQFLSKDSYEGDTSNPITLHKYLYAHANPVTYEDPSGYLAQTVAAAGIQAQLNKIDVGAKLPVLALAGTVAVGLTAHILSQQGLINILDGISTGENLRNLFNAVRWAAAGDVSVAISEADLEGKAIEARDRMVAYAQTLSSKKRRDMTTIAAGYNKVTGQIAVAAKSSEILGDTLCVEDLVVMQLGGIGSIHDIVMTPAIRPRTMQVIPVCKRCQAKYPRSSFISGTQFQ